MKNRPIGTNIRAICELLDVHGALTSREINGFMPNTDPAVVRKYCSRAVGHKLMSVNRMSYPQTYKTIPGWKNKLGSAYEPEVAVVIKEKVVQPVVRRVSSVWDLGGMNLL